LDQASPPDARYLLESQIRECYGRCAYTHKTHEKMAERLAVRQKVGKWANIVLSALITGGAAAVIFAPNTPFFAYTTGALSILSPGATHEISCRYCTGLHGYPAMSLSM